ncbi:beta-1,6-N-acetylglucosaminyltransferase [Bacillus massilinigeriensis]|uniref:beta-1,6-N-acetylglucosaminyltransferase n=1 Tax=Bacillus massilionigeriensis TaxID=1805475 RepID=UPI00096B28D7|nr:beta-1,6-N-acetylglucosaminyltransferase [Bacillus massilionigeriensis]
MSDLLKTAMILQVHKNPDQLNRFIRQLLSENQADVYVHIDQKAYHSMNGAIVESPHVTVLKQCVSCEWGDISQVDATLLLLKEVIKSNKSYDYVCLRSGQDLLVKNGFKSFLKESDNKIFMTYRKLTGKELGLMNINWPKMTRNRYTSIHPIRIFRKVFLYLFSKGINLVPNRGYWPEEYHFYKGSQWFTIPLDVAKYIVEFIENNEWYYQYFKNSLVPDESFFQTLIMNSPYKDRVLNNNLYFLKWGETLGERNSPQNLTSNDIDLIVNDNQFFARKFDEAIDSKVIEYFAENVHFEGITKRQFLKA